MFDSMNGIAVTAPAASTPGSAAMRSSVASKNPRSRSGPGLRSHANTCSTATPPRANPASRLTRLTKLLSSSAAPDTSTSARATSEATSAERIRR